MTLFRVPDGCGAFCWLKKLDDERQMIMPIYEEGERADEGWRKVPQDHEKAGLFRPDTHGNIWACPKCALSLGLVAVLTPGFRRALEVLHDKKGVMLPSELAERLWPASPFWHVSYKCGQQGATRGSALWRSAGGLLGKLVKRGLAQVVYKKEGSGVRLRGYEITSSGDLALLRGYYDVPQAMRK